MSRMTAHRRTALAATAVTPLLLSLWTAAPALAHGAPTGPASRAFACSPEGGSAGNAACRAAAAASGQNFAAWDDIRVPNVGGRDRQTIPDGKLCSGGLASYKGLDLARADFPATRVSPGGTLTMTYTATIAHAGTFKLFLTKPGYDPSKSLTWSDLPTQPFAQITDPKLSNGAYHFSARLPSDRTGHQVLYTIWQTSSTPDTYYSCSDVVFPKAATSSKATSAARTTAPASAPAHASTRPSPSASAHRSATPSAGASTPAAARTSEPAAVAAAADSTPVAAGTDAGSGPSAPLLAGGAAAVLVLTGGAALFSRLRRR
ncbi:lytic polysaccharide monooxygenase [Streptomyces sp. NPDC059378]|uniref:lytic polysaccharide monooxygenase auxiliary activity family 9 protein n=1 Tax=Streptomyces sp. NPDC059378 TaxID=3346815 RepID=UPI003674F67A